MEVYPGISGAVTVVTGAAQGNGKAIAEGFAKRGARVVVCDVKVDEVNSVAEEIRIEGGEAVAFALDVTDKAACEKLASKVGEAFGAPISVLVNNAGIVRRTQLDSKTFATDWDAMLSVNATGSMNMISACLSQLKESKGRIVNLGSVMSVSAGPGLTGYAASKGAVLQMTRALAHELSDFGIRINAIAPGVIETPMTAATRENPEALGRFMAHTPMRRMGQPNELIGPVLFLASDAASYVTGTLLPVDGGYLTA